MDLLFLCGWMLCGLVLCLFCLWCLFGLVVDFVLRLVCVLIVVCLRFISGLYY